MQIQSPFVSVPKVHNRNILLYGVCVNTLTINSIPVMSLVFLTEALHSWRDRLVTITGNYLSSRKCSVPPNTTTVVSLSSIYVELTGLSVSSVHSARFININSNSYK